MSGAVFHAPLIASHPGFALTTVCERSSHHSQKKYPGVKVVLNAENVFTDPSIDLIIVNTPNSLHFSQAKRALEEGKHVVVEKPFTITSTEAQTLIDLAKKRGKILSVFQNRRWDGDFMTVRKLVSSKLLGKLVELEAHYDRFRNYVEANTWKEEAGPGSGILYNLGSHMIDQALVLFGKPSSITAEIGIQRPGGQIEDNYDIRLHYDGLRVILKSSYLVREMGPRYVLHGTDGSFVKYGLDPQEDALKAGSIPTGANWGAELPEYWGKLNTQVNGLHVEGKIETIKGAYPDFYTNIYETIAEGKELAVKPEEALDVIRIIEAAIESSKQKKTIHLS